MPSLLFILFLFDIPGDGIDSFDFVLLNYVVLRVKGLFMDILLWIGDIMLFILIFSVDFTFGVIVEN